MSITFFEENFRKNLFNFILTKNKSILKKPFAFAEPLGKWYLLHDGNTPLVHFKLDLRYEFLFLGTVFDLCKQDPYISSGHYVGFCWDETDKSITVFRNQNSFIGIYYTHTVDSQFIYGNFLLTKAITPLILELNTPLSKNF